jgi:hypothetical protein
MLLANMDASVVGEYGERRWQITLSANMDANNVVGEFVGK